MAEAVLITYPNSSTSRVDPVKIKPQARSPKYQHFSRDYHRCLLAWRPTALIRDLVSANSANSQTDVKWKSLQSGSTF
eukprot:scaffold204193_cov24-Prasinocladus_malaysianus.AAC.1